jgi:hypothetical protein
MLLRAARKKGDGADIDPEVIQVILECRAEHPEWSAERLRKTLRIKKSVVDRVLNGGGPP